MEGLPWSYQMTFNPETVNHDMKRGDFSALERAMVAAEGCGEDFMVLYAMVLTLHARLTVQQDQIKELQHALEGTNE